MSAESVTVTTAEAARIAGVPEPRLRKWVSRGLIERQDDGNLSLPDVWRCAGERVSPRVRRARREAWDRICADSIMATDRTA